MSRDSLRPYFLMLCGTFCFAWMGTMTHYSGRYFGWQQVAIIRSLIPFVVVALWAWSAGVRFVVWRPKILWLRSIAGSLSLVGTFYALTHLPVSDVFTLTNMFPIWVALLSWPLLGEIPSLKVWCSVLIGALGVILVQRPHLLQGNIASLVAMAVSLATALAMIGLHQLKEIDTRAVVVHFSGVSLLFSLLALGIFEHEPPLFEPSLGPWLALVGVGVMATFGQMFLTVAFTTGQPAKLSVVGLMQIVFTLILDQVVLGNTPSAEKLLGIPLVIGPTAWLLLSKRPPEVEIPEDFLENP